MLRASKEISPLVPFCKFLAVVLDLKDLPHDQRPALRVGPYELDRYQFSHMQNYDVADLERYAQHYVQFDPQPARGLASPGTVTRWSELIPRWGRDPLSGEFAPSIGARFAASGYFPLPGGLLLAIGSMRGPGDEDYSQRELSLLKLVLPHVAKAAGAGILSDLTKSGRGRSVGVGGVLLFDSTARVLDADSGALSLLRACRLAQPLDFLADRVRAHLASGAAGLMVLDGVLPLQPQGWAQIQIIRADTAASGGLVVLLQTIPIGTRAYLNCELEHTGLTSREQEVARLAIQGLGNREIARDLRPPVSAQTVKRHLQNVFRKVGVSGRTELAARLLGHAHDRGDLLSP
ncbi:MAG: LuxR C-terminal-related transcriptional regulator [Planctomycetota bacterium]